MFEIVLYEPEIPPNTGNIMRLAANTGARLHLIEPLGFVLSDRRLRRAGLDYEDKAHTQIHASLADCERALTQQEPHHPVGCADDPPHERRSDRRWFAVSTRGQRLYSEAAYRPGDVFLFGPETRGLAESVLAIFPTENVIRLPMAASSRSLNLANAVAVVVFEAWRQSGFQNAVPSPAGAAEPPSG
jgi:tRNA (cytidine/uridine-2'-O-)-methyltransferase